MLPPSAKFHAARIRRSLKRSLLPAKAGNERQNPNNRKTYETTFIAGCFSI
jgi:hypothetical protein